MSKQHSWPFPCIKPKFLGHSLPDEVVRLVASFALPPHPLKEAAWFWDSDDIGMGAWEFLGVSIDEEDPNDSFIANWFGTNVLVILNYLDASFISPLKYGILQVNFYT